MANQNWFIAQDVNIQDSQNKSYLSNTLGNLEQRVQTAFDDTDDAIGTAMDTAIDTAVASAVGTAVSEANSFSEELMETHTSTYDHTMLSESSEYKKITVLTQAEYDAITPETGVVYMIREDS